jgi:hypothetical protein
VNEAAELLAPRRGKPPETRVTRHQSLVTRHSSLVTRHSSLVTRHPSLVTKTCMANGDKDLARLNYKKSFEVDPQNRDATTC